MRIFQVFSGSANSALQNNNAWYRNLYEPLVDMGHDIVYFSAEDGLRARQHNDSSLRAAFSEKLLNAFKREQAKKPFNLFFAYLSDRMVDGGAICEIKKTGVPTCNFSCNNAHQFGEVRNISRHFDFCLHSEKSAKDSFISVGANPLWWPMASNPKYFRPYDEKRTIPVSFSGANYALRARYISYLLDNGVDVHAFGPTWRFGARSPFRALVKRYIFWIKAFGAASHERQSSRSAFLAEHDFNCKLYANYPNNLHSPISDDALIRLYSQSQISLGFLEVHEGNDPSKSVTRHLHLREFEATMCGALYCTGYTDELAEFFEPDKEVIIYRNELEMLDKVRFFLKNTKEGEAIRAAGHRRAQADHTYHKRYQELFAALKLPK